MDTISMHLDIENSLNETLKQTQVLMKGFNDNLQISSKNMGEVEKQAKATTAHYDDLDESSKKIADNTGVWREGLSKIRTTVSYIVPGIATIFSVAGILESAKAAFDYNTELKNLSFRMGAMGDDTTELRKGLFGIVRDTGLAQEQAKQLVVALRSARVATSDIRELGTAVAQFSDITGMSAEGTTKLGAELVRTGKLSIASTKSVLTSMAQVQRSVGFADAEMEQLGGSIVENTRWLTGMGKSAGFIDSFSKGTAKLAGSFSSVGLAVSDATELLDRMLDPGKIEDNALLFAKLGISMQDALTGDLDPGTMAEKFKGLSEEMSGMSRVAQSQLAQSMGVPLKTLQAMVNAQTEFSEGEGDLGTMYKEQESAGEKIERTMNRVQGEMSNAFSVLVEGADKLMDKFQGLPIFNKGLWIAGIAVGAILLVALVKKLKKGFFAMATDFGEVLTKATTEAITMGQEKASIISEKRPRRTGRKEAKAQRIEGGDMFAGMEDTANYFDLLADSELFGSIKNMSKNTADWLRKIAMGSKGLSRLQQITKENNQAITDRVKMQGQERRILTENLSIRMEAKDTLYTELKTRQEILKGMNRTARQEKELSMISKEMNKTERQRMRLGKTRDGIEKSYTKSMERQVRHLQPEAAKAMYQEIKDNQVNLDQQKSLLAARRESINAQKGAVAAQAKALENRINSGRLSTEEASKTTKQLREANELLEEINVESYEVDSNFNNINKELGKSNDQMEDFLKISKLNAKELEGIDSPLREGFTTKAARAIGSTFRKAGSHIVDAFDKAKKSAKAMGQNIVEKLKPSNWLKAIRTKMRGFGDKEHKESTGAMKGLGKMMAKMAIPMAIMGIAMKILAPVFKQLEPVIQTLIDTLKPIAETIIQKLVPPLLRFFKDMIPLLASLINLLLPPLLQVLGFLLKVAGKVLEVIGGLISSMSELGRNLKSAFMTKDKLREKMLEDPETLKRVQAEMQKYASREVITIEMARKKIEDTKDKDTLRQMFTQMGPKGPVGLVLDKVGDFVSKFGIQLQDTGQTVSDLGTFFSKNPAITKEMQDEIMKALGDAADKMEVFRFDENGNDTTTAGAQAALLRAQANGGVEVESEAVMVDTNQQTAENTKELVEETGMLAELQKSSNDKMDNLIVTMNSMVGSVNRLITELATRST